MQRSHDIFNLNEQVAKETELCSFLTSYALLFYAQNSSVKSKNYTDWIEEKFIQHNKSSNLIKNVANALIEDLSISKDLFTLEQTSLYETFA